MELAFVFILIFARVLAVVMTAPLLGNRAVGIVPKLGIAIGVSLVALPVVNSSGMDMGMVATLSWTGLVSAVFAEVVIGALLGLGVMILFVAAQMVGTIIGQMAGIQFGDQSESTGNPGTSVARLFGIVSLAVFALIGGPELLMGSVLETFSNVPLGTSLKTSAVLELLAGLLQQSFMLTIRAVAPALASLLVATWVIGMIGRTYPQMNMLQVGLSSNLVVMLLAIFLTLGGCVWLFVDDLSNAMETIQATLGNVQVQNP